MDHDPCALDRTAGAVLGDGPADGPVHGEGHIDEKAGQGVSRNDVDAVGRASHRGGRRRSRRVEADTAGALRVRFSVGNPRGTLRPGLYGNAIFELPGATTLTVPRDAVVDTGRQQHVFVSTGDRFEPRAVTLGVQLADRIEILSGLTAGERVVAAGVFLLDSESRLRATGPGCRTSMCVATRPPLSESASTPTASNPTPSQPTRPIGSPTNDIPNAVRRGALPRASG